MFARQNIINTAGEHSSPLQKKELFIINCGEWAIFQPIMQLLGFILRIFYNLVQNYGVSIILFTIFIKILLIPLTMKQQKSALKMQKIQPLLKEVQEKYKNDKEKLNIETMKLYKANGANPLASCLPLLIQMPILLSLFWVVQAPITYMMGIGAGEVRYLAAALESWLADSSNMAYLSDNYANLYENLGDAVNRVLTYDGARFGLLEIDITNLLNNRPDILYTIPELGIQPIDFQFLGLDLSGQPYWGPALMQPRPNLLWIIPVLAGATTYLSSQFMQKFNPTPQPAAAEGQPNPMKSMMMFFPLITVWFAFTFPAGVGLYWIISNVLQTVQQWGVNKFLQPKSNHETEVIEVNAEKNRKFRKNS